MAEGRKSKPRSRPNRPIGLSKDGPSKKNPLPIQKDGGWFIPAPLSNRLHQKSALGVPVEGGIILNDEELMFCHWHRHIPLPSNWVEDRLSENENFAHKAVAFDVVRNAGDKVVPIEGKWLRWSRESHPSKGEALAEVKWARTGDSFDIDELLDWTTEVIANNMQCEIAIVDDEMDVTMYKLSLVDPRGKLEPATRDKYPNLGIEHLSRIFLRDDETQWLEGIENDVTDLFDELNSRGLLMRPGFKYGCRWRVYTTPVDVDHAPWLMQMEAESPTNWEEVCLSVRLAEGVNKGWVIALKRGDWVFLNISRHLPGR